MNADRDFDKILLTLGLVISAALVVFASKYDATLLEWAKGIFASVFGAWLLYLNRDFLRNGKGNGSGTLPPSAT